MSDVTVKKIEDMEAVYGGALLVLGGTPGKAYQRRRGRSSVEAPKSSRLRTRR